MTEQRKKFKTPPQCEELETGSKLECADLYNCCACGADDQENGCGCRYCFSCNACSTCLED